MKSWKKNIILFLFSQNISLFGSSLVYYSIMWHIAIGTKSSVMLAFMSIIGAIPLLLVLPFAGVLADRYNKKLVINIADGMVAFFTLILSLSFKFHIESKILFFLLIILRVIGQSIHSPCVSALVPELIPKSEYLKINGIKSGLDSFIRFASPMLAGVILSVFSIDKVLLIDVITASIGIFILAFFVKTTPVNEELKEEKVDNSPKQYLLDIKEGFKYIYKSKVLFKIIAVGALFSFIEPPFATLTPLQVVRNYGEETFNFLNILRITQENRLAIIESAFFLGMIFGSFFIGFIGGFKNKSYTLFATSIVLSIVGASLGIVKNFYIYTMFMFLCGVAVNLYVPPSITILQNNIDAKYRGRVFSVIRMISSFMFQIGMLIWGPLGDIISIDSILIIAGMLTFIFAFFYILDKDLLKAGTK